jgi:hypothetical protein
VFNLFASPPSRGASRAPVERFGGFREPVVNFTNGTTGFGLHAASRAFPAARFEDVLGTLDGISEREARGKPVVALCAQHLRRLS